VGGKDAADAPIASEVRAQRAFERTAIPTFTNNHDKKLNKRCREELDKHTIARVCSGIT
jgi:hypothetical protein